MPRKKEEDLVKNLQPGKELKGALFAVGKAEEKIASNRSPFFSLRLKDATGACTGQIWPRSERERDEAKGIKPGDVIAVNAVVEEFKGIKIVKVRGPFEIVPEGEYDELDFIGQSGKDAEQMLQKVRETAAKMGDPHLKALCGHFVSDPEFAEALRRCPGAESKHHCYPGGLLAHTLEVLEICRLMLDLHPELKGDLLLAGALLHDVGKLETYGYKGAAIVMTPKNNLIGHIQLGIMKVKQAIEEVRKKGGFPEELENQLLHLMASHHGQVELGYGSPIDPRTPEAFALFNADNLSAQVEGSIPRSVDCW